MKKHALLALMIALLAMLLLSACGETPEPDPEPTPAPTSQPSPEPAETPEPEETAPVTNLGDAPDFGPLSDDPYAFQLELDGVVYQFPMTYAQLLSFGWEYKDDEDEMLDSGYYKSSGHFTKGDMTVYFSIINLDINALPVKNCIIGGINIDWFGLRNLPDTSIILPRGIVFGEATADDVRSAYGTPSYEAVTSGGLEIVEYSLDYRQEIKLNFNAETGILDKININNYIAPPDFEVSEVSSEIPEIVGRYTVPTAISNNFADWTFNYGGKIYTLPAPLSEFVDDGWVIDENDSQMIIEGRGYGWVTIRKDNQKLRVIVNNYSEGATAVTNCFMTSVRSDQSDAKISLTIANGITIGMSNTDVKAALSGATVEEGESSTYYYYNVYPTDSKSHYYSILLHNNTDEVYTITITYGPRYTDYINR